jgi:hypothetical protein
MIDTSVVRVHRRGACIADNNRQNMGPSRGGLTSQNGLMQNQHDGQFAHGSRAQIARRVTLSQSLLLLKIGNHPILPNSPPREEGRYGQSSPNVRRVAVDAIDARTKRTMRSTKPCGPDTPMLVSSFVRLFPRSDGD